MGVYTALTAITLTAGEKAAAAAKGEDASGTLNSALVGSNDLAETLTVLATQIGAGANATALLAQVTALA